MTHVPDFVVQTAGGWKFFRSDEAAIAYAQEHDLRAFRMDYEMVSDGHIPHEQQVRTLLYGPEARAA